MFVDDTYLTISAKNKGGFYQGALSCFLKQTDKPIWVSIMPIARLTPEDAIEDVKVEIADLEAQGLQFATIKEL